MFCVQKATCSVSAKKSSTVRSRPAGRRAELHQLLGDDLGGVEDVEVEGVGEVVVEQLDTELPLGEVPVLMASHRSRRWKSGSAPLILTASFHTTDCRPSFGFQWNLTNVDSPAALTKRKVWTRSPP